MVVAYTCGRLPERQATCTPTRPNSPISRLFNVTLVTTAKEKNASPLARLRARTSVIPALIPSRASPESISVAIRHDSPIRQEGFRGARTIRHPLSPSSSHVILTEDASAWATISLIVDTPRCCPQEYERRKPGKAT